jgi:hypothetical protein
MINSTLSMSSLNPLATPATFPKFPILSLEIRRKIWFHALHVPRVLHILLKPQEPGLYTIVVSPASYGGYQPPLLSVNRESRAEALRYLTPLFGMYWNLEVDAPYFEIPHGDDMREEVTWLRRMRMLGVLAPFKRLAVDWRIWDWGPRGRTMEFRACVPRGLVENYEHP